MISRFAEQLTADWARRHHTTIEAREEVLAEHILRQLADPESDYGGLLDELCRSRWTADQVVGS